MDEARKLIKNDTAVAEPAATDCGSADVNGPNMTPPPIVTPVNLNYLIQNVITLNRTENGITLNKMLIV
jgi:hypothetical protein